MTYLDAMMVSARVAVEHRRATKSLEDLRAQPPVARASFENALRAAGIATIAEFKRASPSAGTITDASVGEIVTAYEQGGATAISVLTDDEHFGGSLNDLEQAAFATALPLLRKDFVSEDYQIVEAARAGASAVLLIVAGLTPTDLVGLHGCAVAEGLDVLVEIHDEVELEVALDSGARIIGINNRNLHDLSVDLETAMRIAPLVPAGILRVAESGIRSADDVRRLRGCGVDAILVGESLLRAPDVAAACRALTSV